MDSALLERVQSLRGSSLFRSGDAGSFKVLIGDEQLPGKHCPAEYLDALGITEVEGKVGVVCPGNAGLMAELRRRGADRVVGFEPRYQFQKSLTTILQILNESDGSTIWPYSSSPWWPGTTPIKNTFDMMIWAEGLEWSRMPAFQMQGALGNLKPGGIMIVEVNHGENGLPEGATNRWRPTKEAFEAAVKVVAPEADVIRVSDGRLAGRVVYMIRDEVVVLEDSTVRSDGVLDEDDLNKEALSHFPEEVQERIQSLMATGFDYHVLKEAYGNNGEAGLKELEESNHQL